MQQRHQRGDQLLPVALYSGVVALHHQVIAEAVYHHPRQGIAVAIHQAVERFLEGRLPTRQGGRQATLNEFAIEVERLPRRIDAAADQRLGLHVGRTQDASGGIPDDYQVAGSEMAQRVAGRVDFIGVDPQVPAAQATVGAAAQEQLSGRRRSHWAWLRQSSSSHWAWYSSADNRASSSLASAGCSL